MQPSYHPQASNERTRNERNQMRLSLPLLLSLLVMSPGDGMGRRLAATPMPEVWNPLRPWQHLSPDSGDTGKRRMTTLGRGLLVYQDGQQLALIQRDRPACPMLVVSLPDSESSRPRTAKRPRGSFRVFGDSIDPAARSSMPIVRSGCWNPLFRKTAPETSKDTVSP